MMMLINVLVYTSEVHSVKRFNAQKYYLPQGIMKNCIVITKNFYDKAVDSDIKPEEEIRKLTTGQGEPYTTGC